jgi:hypothetical protein
MVRHFLIASFLTEEGRVWYQRTCPFRELYDGRHLKCLESLGREHRCHSKPMLHKSALFVNMLGHVAHVTSDFQSHSSSYWI